MTKYLATSCLTISAFVPEKRMRLLFGFSVFLFWLWNMIISIRYSLDKKILTAHRFATIISFDLSMMTFFLFFFFVGLKEIEMPTNWIILGLGITLLNFIGSYPIAWYFYKFFVRLRE